MILCNKTTFPHAYDDSEKPVIGSMEAIEPSIIQEFVTYRIDGKAVARMDFISDDIEWTGHFASKLDGAARSEIERRLKTFLLYDDGQWELEPCERCLEWWPLGRLLPYWGKHHE